MRVGELPTRGRVALGAARQARHTRVALRGAEVGRNARISGRPTIDVAHLSIGDDFLLWSHEATTLLAGVGRLTIGDRVFINSGALVYAHLDVTIEDDVALGLQSIVTDSDMHGIEGRPARRAAVTIGAGSWVGMRAMVLPGVRIGRRVVVAAGAVVTGDVEDDLLVAGVPATTVRRLHYPPGVVRAWSDLPVPDEL